jgi:hypothetical protein
VRPLEVSQEGAVAPVVSSKDEGLRVFAKDLNAMCYPLAGATSSRYSADGYFPIVEHVEGPH